MGVQWAKVGMGAIFLPQLLVTTIASVEKLKGPGNGADKKEAVKDIVGTAMVTGGMVTGNAAYMDPNINAALGSAIDAIVALMNVQKAAAPAAAPAPAPAKS